MAASPDPHGAPPAVRAEPPARSPDVDAPRVDWRRVHLWQIQPVRDLLLIAAFAGLIYLGSKISIVTVPLLLALLMAYLFEPLVQWVTRRTRIGRKGVVSAIIAAVVIAVVVPTTLALTYGVIQGVGFAGRLADNIRTVLRSVDNPNDPDLRSRIRGQAWRDIRDYLVERQAPPQTMGPPLPPPDPAAPGPAPVENEQDPEAPAEDEPTDDGPGLAASLIDHESSASAIKTAMRWIEQNAAEIASTVGKTAVGSGAQAIMTVVGMFTSVGMLLFTLFLTMFFFFFMSVGWGRVLAWGGQFIPREDRSRWVASIRRMDRVIAGFVRGRLTICAILALHMTVAYWIIGVPGWMILGPVIGMLFIVPFIHVIGVPIAALLMWLQSDATGFRAEWWWIVFAPIAVYLIAQFLDDWVLTPIIQGNNTEMDTPTILFASIAGGALAGIYGLLLAIPVAACLKILFQEFVWPRVEAWLKGHAQDPLPISRE